jgi:hypothetical protein
MGFTATWRPWARTAESVSALFDISSRIVASLDRKRLGHDSSGKAETDRGVFDKEPRSKPLADAVCYGI